MTRSEQYLEKAIKMLTIAQADAKKDFTIKKPTAYALYHVWKYFDAHENERYEKYGSRRNKEGN